MNLQRIILILIISTVVITLLLAYINAQTAANDQKRLADISQIRLALKVYFDQNGFYPSASNGIPKEIEKYLSFWPQAPKSNGNCTDEGNTYRYSLKPGMDYTISFCLGSSGFHSATSKGIE